MELEFDKEIDALLRKGRTAGGVTTPGEHLDADAINAFAENAVPASLRAVYTKHFADCDRCRGLLSQAALLNEPLAAKAMTAPAAPAHAAPWPPPERAPWYRSLFRAPGLAAAMGVLVLALGAGLIYLVTQRNAPNSVAMSPSALNANFSIPYSGIESNAMSNTAASNANEAAVANTAASVTRSSNASSNSGPAAGERNTVASGTGTGFGSASSTSAGAAPQPLAEAPPPVTAGSIAAKPEDKPKTDTGGRREEKESGRGRALDDDRTARNAAALSKKSVGGSLRVAGPVQGNVQSNAQAYEMPVTRKVAGKTFHNSGGAWYDSAYRGQSTTNVKRNTDEYKKLDSGLRSIASELGGVVVLVWKDKAYRID